MTLHKMIDGVKIDLTPQEEEEFSDYWKINEELERKKVYLEQRQSEYPTLFEVTETLVDILDHLSNTGVDLGTSANKLLTEVKRIRNKYPNSI